MAILVTGAGGLLGGAVAAELAARGHRVRALLRRPGPVLAHDGGPAGSRVEPVMGDVCAPGLGLDAGALAGTAAIVHCAALTGFAEPASAYQAVNVTGTAHALALAARLAVPLVHVSTAYVCGHRSGPVAETELSAEGFANGYEASKAEAERLCRAAIARGQPVVVARPSILVGGWADGAIRRFGDAYLLLRLFALGRLRTMPAVPHATLDLVPIDRVATGIARLAEQPGAWAGRTLHLSSGAPVTLADLKAEAAARGYPVPCFVSPDAFDRCALPAAEARLHRGIGALYASYVARSPQFDRSNAAVLPGFDRPCGGPPLLGRIVSFAIAAGFLPPACLSARPDSGAPAPA